MVEAPCYPPIRDAAFEVTQNEPICVQRRRDGRFDLTKLQKTLEEVPKRAKCNRVELFILSNPHNPTGTLLRAEELKGIAATFEAAGSSAKIVVDEAFLGLVPLSVRPPAAVTIDPERFISVGGLTKSYGLGWLRCGWILAEQDLASSLEKSRILTKNFGSDYLAALGVRAFGKLDEIESWAASELSKNVKAWQELIGPRLGREIRVWGQSPGYGGLSFMCVPDRKGRPPSDALKKRGIYVAPGGWLGPRWADYFRINIAGESRKMKKSLMQLAEALNDIP